jgi:predicted small metal-binding protein
MHITLVLAKILCYKIAIFLGRGERWKMKKKKQNRITKEILETAKGMHKIGIIDNDTYKKIKKRHLLKEKNEEIKN